MIDSRTPVIIGVGQFLNRVDQGAEPLEPSDLMIEAVRLAESDSGAANCVSHAQIFAAVPTITWRYRDPAAIVAAAFGSTDATTWYATVGGNTPQMMVNRLCRTIAEGKTDLAVLCGAEAGRTRSIAKRRGARLEWTIQADEVAPDWLDESPLLMGGPADMARNIVMPLQTYPLFENAIWHNSGRTLADHLKSVGEMWSGLSGVAESNPYAWNRESFTAQEIITPSADNRLLGFPYTKRMVSNPYVDMASAAIICSAERARALDVPRDRWVFVHSGTDAVDRSISERADFFSSPAISAAGTTALELAGATIDEVAHLDLYSCYPSAVQLAVNELKVPATRQLTVYGGLAFAGGPWNNPVGHALASMVGVLREDPGSLGLITANGGNVDKHSFGVYSSEPPKARFRYDRPQGLVDQTPGRVAIVDHDGAATIETWTVMHDHDGSPERAHAACLTAEGSRTWAVTSDADTIAAMVGADMTGERVTIDGAGEMKPL